jgi:muconolactone D-isomerase
MEFLADMVTTVPDGTPEDVVADTKNREAARARQLAEQRHLLRLWKPPNVTGEWRTLGLFAAEDEQDLRQILGSLPLHPWMKVEVTPLTPHPNDPGSERLMSAPQLPEAIATFQAAHDRHDVEAALSAFTVDAAVHDEDQDWVGTDQIRQWLIKTSTEYTFTRTLLDVEPAGTDSWRVRNRLEGNFPGGVVDLSYQFTLAGANISRLAIAP